jgi:hypothetical protein
VVDYIHRVVPAGWKRIRSTSKVDRSVQKEFMEDLVDLSWRPSRSEDIPSGDVSRGPCAADLRTRFCDRRVRLLGRFRLPGSDTVQVGRRAVASYLRSRDGITWVRERGVPRWVRESVAEELTAWLRPLCFSRGGYE